MSRHRQKNGLSYFCGPSPKVEFVQLVGASSMQEFMRGVQLSFTVRLSLVIENTHSASSSEWVGVRVNGLMDTQAPCGAVSASNGSHNSPLLFYLKLPKG